MDIKRLWTELKTSTQLSRKDMLGVGISSFFINLLALALPITFLQAYDRIIPNHSEDTLILLILLVAFLIILENILKYLRHHIIDWQYAKISHQSLSNYFNRMIHSDTIKTDETKKSLFKQIDLSNQVQNKALTLAIDLPFSIIFFLIIMSLDVRLVLPAISCIVFISWAYITKKDSITFSQLKASKLNDKKENFTHQLLKKILSIKSTNLEESMLRQYEYINHRYTQQQGLSNQKKNHLLLISETLSVVNIFATLAIGGYLVIENQLSLGGLAATILLTSRLLLPFQKLITVWVDTTHAENKTNTHVNNPILGNKEKTQNIELNGDIEVNHLDFDAGRETIRNISFSIQKDQIFCITEPYNKIKSNLLPILLGKQNKISGNILYSDFALHKHLNQIRQQVYHLESADLLTGTIRENISLFTNNQSVIHKATNIFTKFYTQKSLRTLNKGLDTSLNIDTDLPKNKNLIESIILTRAIIKNPKILFIDDYRLNLSSNHISTLIGILKEHQITTLIASDKEEIISLSDNHLNLINPSKRFTDNGNQVNG